MRPRFDLPEPVEEVSPPARPTRFLAWLAQRQRRSIFAGCLVDTIWLLGLALFPFAVGRAIDEGIVGGDLRSLLGWVGLLLWLQVQHAAIQGIRDRQGIINWSRAAYRSVGQLGRAVTRSGTALARRASAGELALTAAGDSFGLGHLYYLIGGLTSSVIAYTVVGILLLTASVPLGLLVLVGVPAFSAIYVLLVKPLRERQGAHRAAAGAMSTVAADIVGGLRVVRGIGGESILAARYRERSAATRDAGMRVAWPLAIVDGLQVLIAGILVVALTWAGALAVLDGQLRVGELVSFYGYATFLVLPIRVIAEALANATRAHVAAGRITDVVRVDPLLADPANPTPIPPAAVIIDPATGLRLAPGEIVGVVSERPEDGTELADRLSRLTDAAEPATWGGVATDDVAIVDLRARAVVSDPEPFFFSGTVRAQLDPHGRHDDDDILRAVHAAAGDDVLTTLSEGLDTELTQRARDVSGGQRQRLGLARALLAADDLLVLIAPTSAVDSHTEARIATRLHAARAGRTTVVVSSSPALLAEADRVVLLRDGRVTASGSHHELLESDEMYRDIVGREEGLS